MSEAAPASGPPSATTWQKLLPWAITIACFAYLYTRISGWLCCRFSSSGEPSPDYCQIRWRSSTI